MNGNLKRNEVIRTSDKPVPFFSVIICTYERAELIQRALRSLFAQTEHDWEAVIIDDGSSDGTFEAVSPLIRDKENIKYTRLSHRGVSYCRNTGILLSTGKYITFLDSDDEYAPEHLGLRKEALLSDPSIDLLHGGVKVVGECYVPDKNDESCLIHIRDCVVGGTFFFTKENAGRLGGFDNLAYADDTSFFEKHVAAGLKISRTDHETYIYHRDTPDSLCNLMMDKK